MDSSGRRHPITWPVAIKRAPPDLLPLYQSSRYVYEGEKFAYLFHLPNGRYRVILKFADYSYDAPGHYSFDVKLNGERVLAKFDPDAVYKTSKTAVDKQFQTIVTNKLLRIDFIANFGAAFINGIEIEPIDPAQAR